MNKEKFERNVDDVLCFDNVSGRPFCSNTNKIERALMQSPFRVEAMTLNDFYDEIGMIDIKYVFKGGKQYE